MALSDHLIPTYWGVGMVGVKAIDVWKEQEGGLLMTRKEIILYFWGYAKN